MRVRIDKRTVWVSRGRAEDASNAPHPAPVFAPLVAWIQPLSDAPCTRLLAVPPAPPPEQS